MRPYEIKKGIYWVGGIDWDIRNFHGYSTTRGTTYNAYLIMDEKITLVDTVKHYLFDEMIERVSRVVDPSRIDSIVSNHVEMDHSGGLVRLSKICPNASIITSPNGEKGLRQHYGHDLNLKTVNTGDSISIGKRSLRFVLTQMVHWPDSMATYIPEEKLLLPNDAFGQHMATSERFDDEVGWDIVREEAAKYYANIVLPYGQQVLKALDAIKGLDIDMIAPSHGLIWRKRIPDIVAEYRKWASNVTAEEAVVVYDSMWGSTEKIARKIYDVFEERKIRASLCCLKTNDISDVMTKVLSAKYVCVGSPTLNNNMMPTVASFITYLKGLAPKNRRAMAFGSYGWGGQSVGQIEEALRISGFETMESVKAQYVPDEKTLSEIGEKIKGGLL